MVNCTFVDPELHGEPTLEEMLADPIVRLIMSRDGVNEGDMRTQLDRAQHHYQATLEIQ